MKGEHRPAGKWRNSIRTKLLIGFGCVITVILLCAVLVYYKASNVATRLTYENMCAQAEYYTQTVSDELEHIRLLQVDMFNDRSIWFLIGPQIDLSEYEKREQLLSVWNKVGTIEGASSLIESGTVYLPRSGYRITAGGVRRIGQEDQETIRKYMQYLDGKVHFEEDCMFLVEDGELGRSSEYLPKHMFVIRFSKEQILGDLAKLNTTEESGAFWYQDEQDIMYEYSGVSPVGRQILESLSRDSDGSYENTQWVTVEGRKYLVIARTHPLIGLFVTYCPENVIMRPVTEFKYAVSGLFVCMILGTVFYAFYANNLVHRPMRELVCAFQRIESGNWKEHIAHRRKDEFSYIYDEFNEMQDHMAEMIEQVCIQTNLAQRAQMKQLQAQIAPHFLFNSFFALSRKIKRGDYEAAEAMAKYMGTFFEYVTRNEADYVTLDREVFHAKSYADIQGIRFANRIQIQFEALPENFLRIIVPRLILQPLLENSFEHGLKNKEKDGKLWIHFEETEEDFLIYVEDNGDITDAKLSEITEGLRTERKGEITSFFNIHRRIAYKCRGRGGLRVCRSALGGLCVTACIHKEAADVPEFVDR